MLTDKQGNPISNANAEAIGAYDDALEGFNLYRGDPFSLAETAANTAPGFAMAHILKAFLLVCATEPGAMRDARAIADDLATQTLGEREQSHLIALQHVTKGNWNAAALQLDQHNARYPHDMLALQVGHLFDFFRGSSRNLRDRIARVLPHWDKSRPGYDVLKGMQAFGLEETGDYARAEAAAREALDLEPYDCWAQHALAHVFEMQGRAETGVAWMRDREDYWAADDNLFKVHNWWHKALFHLDLVEGEEALSIYDKHVRADDSELAIDLVDASALLWRAEMANLNVGDRWAEVAARWELHADGTLYPFNDWHAVMAYLGAGRDAEVDRVLKHLRRAAEGDNDVALWVREMGLPLTLGFVAYWRGDYGAATELLHAARYVVTGFGGSLAQRDVIDWTLTEAAIRGGQTDLAQSLANERLAFKPQSPINLDFLSRARTATHAAAE